MTKIRLMIILLGLALVAHVATAQESVVMPDLTGMTVPVAAATLNRAGIGIGQETGERWTEESGLPRNTIGAQSVEPGTPVAPGSTVDLTVLRSPNVQVIYDDNDLTLVNETGGPIQLVIYCFFLP